MQEIEVSTQAAQLNFIVKNNKIYLVYMGSKRIIDSQWKEVVFNNQLESFKLTEINITGEEDHLHIMGKGAKQSGTSSGAELEYESHQVTENTTGKMVIVKQVHPRLRLEVKTFFELFKDCEVIKTWKVVTNLSNEKIGLESIASLSITGVLQQDFYPADYTKNISLALAHNGWTAEAQWSKKLLSEYGLVYLADGMKEEASSKRISINNNSSWSCSEYSPQGILYNQATNQSTIWQIEHNGAWHFEIEDTDNGGLLNLQIMGPEEYDNHWWKSLDMNESFTTVAVSYSQVGGDFEKAIDELTKYRRITRRKNEDNEKMPVIFNDYMNGLMGDPTVENEMPLIDAANEIGAEYYVIDCGWYDSGDWWDTVGEWKQSLERFPNGIVELTDYIRSKGMIPGLWLEIEVMGVNSKLAAELPDNWFFMRHGKRIKDIGRYHLDFRNEEVRKYATSVVDRLVNDYHLGYIKMDYNTPTGIGTDFESDSFGDGLFEHNRAYLKWIDDIFDKYPKLIIENCGSGGLRHDHAMLSRHSIQSLTDQTDYIRNGAIASVGSSIMTPEQCAVWSYPLQKGDQEEVVYNMINSMLGRIHQSGYLNKLTKERLMLVSEAVSVYKKYRHKINQALPIWPNGLGRMDDENVSFGLKTESELLLAVEHNIGDTFVQIDLAKYGEFNKVDIIYPTNDKNIIYSFNQGVLTVHFNNEHVARLFKIYKA
ncbi:glycoside hydrolase family 36 protein [Pediococcus pentosaceus]|uniref:alpha-galactosidase n=1 Tax=Pediococcus pentosaceus TaxID=1255 RepID=UPI00315E6D0B